MHKIYIQFVISGSIIVDEEERDAALGEVLKVVSKFSKNKLMSDVTFSLESSDSEVLSQNKEIAEA